MSVPPQATVSRGLADAVGELYVEDAHLFEIGVGERAVVGRLQLYMSTIVATWPGDWSVDIEYNRATAERYGESVHKVLLDVLGVDVDPAYPDLIIHERGRSGLDGGNLLVVEAKRQPSERAKREDHAKLVAWTREFHYLYAARLELWPQSALCAWVDRSHDQRILVEARTFV